MDDIALTPSQLLTAMRATVKGRGRMLVKGEPGIGKTFIEEQVAEEFKATNVIMHPSVDDPTDYKGYPWMVNGKAMHVPFGKLQILDDAKSLTICMIDDLGQAMTGVQAAVMQMLDRYRKNPHIVFMAATNERGHKAGVSGLLEPVKSRFDSIVKLAAHFPSWKVWAQDHDVDYRILGYLEQHNDALHKFDPSVDIVNQPSPRTWVGASKILGYDLKDEDVRFAMLIGAVGQGAGTAFSAWLKIAEAAPSREEIMSDPKNARIPEQADALYAVASSLAHGFEKKEFPAVAIYMNRLYTAEHGEFCALLFKDIYRKVPDIQTTPAYTQIAKGPMAKLIIEATKFNQTEGK